MHPREFFDEDFYLASLRQYEEMRAFRKSVSAKGRRPSDMELTQMKINKPWEQFYAAILFPHPRERGVNPWSNPCPNL